VTSLIRRNGVTVVYYEAPLPATQQKSMDAAQIALGLEALTLAACRECGVRLVKPVHNGTVKKHFAGTGRADKLAIIEACRRRGWNPDDDNHADALAVADLGVWETWLNRGMAA
jgi:crossover junction endodeoxyribonuclease RuvC